jgi:RNA polymerase sigma-70 factor (ECF subfamily)
VGSQECGGAEGTPGRKDALTLYVEYAGRLKARFRHAGLDAAEAEDALQELFLRVARRALRPGGLDRIREPRRWLFGIARNVLREVAKRREQAQLGLPLDEEPADPDHAVDDEDERRFGRATVNRLPAPIRVVFRLRWWRGFSYREIAARLGITVGAVTMRLHSARERLKRMLKPPDKE